MHISEICDILILQPNQTQSEDHMKLDYRRVFFTGFAFFLICAFWQAYDNIIPKILTDKFGMSQAASGFIMALDNILAVVLLPVFGAKKLFGLFGHCFFLFLLVQWLL